MQRKRMLEWTARTRRYLGEMDPARAVESMLRSLVPDFLSDVLYEEGEGTSRALRNNLDLNQIGALSGYLQREIERPRPMYEHVRELCKRQGMTLNKERIAEKLGLETADSSISVVISFDERPFNKRPIDEYFFGNGLTLTCKQKISSSDVSRRLAASVSRRLYGNDLFDWGHCCRSDEYDANNIDRSGGGICAMGIDVSKMLPGFYWGNYFGPFLIEHIGESKLSEVPGCCVEQLGHGVLVANELPPDEWQSPEYQRNRVAAMEHLGRHLFFEKGKELEGTLFPVEPIPGIPDNAPGTIQIWLE